jgi:tetratricopeptide (TPR) repeat protein
MDIDNITAPHDQTAVARRVSRRQLAQQAITFAMQSRWQEAADVNRRIVEMTPGDAEAFNRLGKAYTELGQISEARSAYEDALKADPANLIAQRNLDRLSRITDAEASELAKRAGQKLDPQFFMEETGKTGLTALRAVAGSDVLATLTAGDQVELREDEGHLVVTTTGGVRIGVVDDALAARITRLMQTGNQYQAGIVGVDNHEVRIIIRETFQAPQNAGRISFPPRVSSDALPRPYLREGLVRRGASGDDEEEEDLDIDLHDDLGEDEDEDASEFGFHEGTLDET